MLHFVLDAESVGLFGDAFAAGFVVVDDADGRELDAKRWVTNPLGVFSHSEEDRAWVRRNVPPLVYNCDNVADVRSWLWRAWEHWRARGAVMWADCPFPVETNLLGVIIDNAPRSRGPHSPYPLYDIATALLMAGMDPLATYPRQPDELPVHDPLADARQSARLLLEALQRAPAARLVLDGADAASA